MQNRENVQNYIEKYLFMLVLVCLLFVANVCIGSVSIPVKEVWNTIIGKGSTSTYRDIIMEIRVPRALAAGLLGGALALAGYLLQTFFHNPIAGPFVLGISSGAKMVVALLMVLVLGSGLQITSIAMIGAAFVGAMLSMFFVLLLAKVVDRMSMLIVAGVMIGYICSAVTEFVITFADDSNIVNLHNWSMGSFSGMSWRDVVAIAVLVILCFGCTFCLAKPISAYQLGEAYAVNMGVNVRFLRIAIVLLSSMLAAGVTAFAGPISFVGIAVPHLVKGLFQTNKPLHMIPACFLGGEVFCLICDLISRVVFAPTELSVSTVTAVFGAPVVIWIMIRKSKRN